MRAVGVVQCMYGRMHQVTDNHHSARRHCKHVLSEGERRFYCLLLLCVGGLYLANNVLPGQEGFRACYLNDCLAGLGFYPAVRVAAYLCRVQKLPAFTNGCPFIIGLTLLAGVFWEYVPPLYREGSTSDPWDLVCYAGGAVCLCLLRRAVCR